MREEFFAVIASAAKQSILAGISLMEIATSLGAPLEELKSREPLI
jgi:hypothetical protein